MENDDIVIGLSINGWRYVLSLCCDCFDDDEKNKILQDLISNANDNEILRLLGYLSADFKMLK